MKRDRFTLFAELWIPKMSIADLRNKSLFTKVSAIKTIFISSSIFSLLFPQARKILKD
jgi:hypothetical protein